MPDLPILTPSECAALAEHAEYADQFRLTFEARLPGPVAEAIIEIVSVAPRMLATIAANEATIAELRKQLEERS